MDEPIPRAHQRTYDAVFQDPPPADLDWRAVRSLLGALANCTSEAHGRVRFDRRGRTLFLQAERHKGRVTDEHALMVRQFLDGPIAPPEVGAGQHLVVVLNEKEGRVYRVEPREGKPEKLAPYDPQGAGRSMLYMQDEPEAEPTPFRESFCEAIGRALKGAGEITILGRGKAAQAAITKLQSYLKEREQTLAGKIGESAVVEINPTMDQLLGKIKQLHRQGETA